MFSTTEIDNLLIEAQASENYIPLKKALQAALGEVNRKIETQKRELKNNIAKERRNPNKTHREIILDMFKKNSDMVDMVLNEELEKYSVDSLGMDSIDLVELIMEIEEHFDIEIDDNSKCIRSVTDSSFETTVAQFINELYEEYPNVFV